jgi:hypothetical protein
MEQIALRKQLERDAMQRNGLMSVVGKNLASWKGTSRDGMTSDGIEWGWNIELVETDLCGREWNEMK